MPASAQLRGQPLTVAGDGSQTRSVCYVDDLIDGIVRLLNSDLPGPVNIGNPEEISVLDLALRIAALAGVEVPVEYVPTVNEPTLNSAPLNAPVGHAPVGHVPVGHVPVEYVVSDRAVGI